MAKRRGARAKPNKKTVQQIELLGRLKDVAAAAGLEVREERLERGSGYSVRSGVCVLQGREVLMLDRNVEPGDRLDVLTNELARRDLDAIYIEPAMREYIGGGPLPPLGDEAKAASETAKPVEAADSAGDG